MKLDEFLTIHQNFLPKISSQYGTGTVSLIFYSLFINFFSMPCGSYNYTKVKRWLHGCVYYMIHNVEDPILFINIKSHDGWHRRRKQGCSGYWSTLALTATE